MTKRKSRFGAFLMLLGLTFGLVNFYAPQAQARGGPIVYSQSGGYVPMSYGTRVTAPVQHWMRNSTRFDMYCWVDDGWYYGNYWTNRWFYGQAYDTGVWGWVNASWVYYQWSVPHC